MPLEFTVTQIGESKAFESTSGTIDNLVVSGATAPNNLKSYFVHFFKHGEFIVDVGIYIEWDTPGMLCNHVSFSFPFSQETMELIPMVKDGGGFEDLIVPVSPIKRASFFTDSNTWVEGETWLQINLTGGPPGVLTFELHSPVALSLMKVTGESRYQRELRRIFLNP